MESSGSGSRKLILMAFQNRSANHAKPSIRQSFQQFRREAAGRSAFINCLRTQARDFSFYKKLNSIATGSGAILVSQRVRSVV
jgi:hypothetical protein